MKVSFFEEYPTKENLGRLKHLRWPSKLYVAAKNLKEFENIRTKVPTTVQLVYWPVLNKNEGYWISPFSKRSALIRIFKELEGKKVPVMLDLELPTRHNPLLYVSQLPNFSRNKNLIQGFITNYKGEVYTAEYYPSGRKERLLQFFGFHYKGSKVIKMLYHSLHEFDKSFVQNQMKNGVQEFGDDYLVGLGTIATGVQGDEPVLSGEQLKQDLILARNAGVQEAIIFRLGGLTEKYTKVIEKLLR
jgi:hypothetical protein